MILRELPDFELDGSRDDLKLGDPKSGRMVSQGFEIKNIHERVARLAERSEGSLTWEYDCTPAV